MQHRRRFARWKTLVAVSSLAAALCPLGCAHGNANRDTVPLCPVPGPDEAVGWDWVLDHVLEAEGALDAFVPWVEDVNHYCDEVLPAWRDS